MEKTIKIQEQNSRVKRRFKIDGIIGAFICITIGIIFLGKNTGFISPYLFKILISWQMLLILLGVYAISHRGYLWGIFVAGTGAFFMIPIINGLGEQWLSAYWPLILIFAGLVMVVKIILPKRKNDWMHHHETNTDFYTENGFVVSNNHFGSTQHVVMDEIFKGAEINNRFGATILDLRRTSFQSGNTYININSYFGGIEIYVPNDCLVLTELNTSMGGVSDERHNQSINVNENSKLVLRGRLSMSGIMIKS